MSDVLPVLRGTVTPGVDRNRRKTLAIHWRLTDASDIPTPPGEAYTCDFSLAKEAADDIRGRLQKFEEALDPAKPESLRIAGLWQVALAGEKLFDALTTPIPEHAAHSTASDFRNWYQEHASKRTDLRIAIIMTGTLDGNDVLPWGLIVAPSAKPRHQPDTLDAVAFFDFWSMRHRLAVYILENAEFTPRIRLPERDDGDEPDDQAEDGFFPPTRPPPCLRILHEHEDRPDILDFGEDLKREFEGSAYLHDTRNHFHSGTLETRDFPQIIYWNLLPKPSEPSDYLIGGERIGAGDLAHQLKHLRRDHVFLMIDRDAVIRGDRGKDWVTMLLGDPRIIGLIAAEVDLHTKWTQRAGFQFLHEVLRVGPPLDHNIQKVRETLWPQSIFFGIYCDPSRICVQAEGDFMELMRNVFENSLGGVRGR